MTTNEILKVMLAMAGLTIAVLLFQLLDERPAHAVEFQEVQPYEFAQVGQAHVWKGVHEGCEYYVIQEHHFEINHGDSISNSLALGRGCR
jgi:hypothetical protein